MSQNKHNLKQTTNHQNYQIHATKSLPLKQINRNNSSITQTNSKPSKSITQNPHKANQKLNPKQTNKPITQIKPTINNQRNRKSKPPNTKSSNAQQLTTQTQRN